MFNSFLGKLNNLSLLNGPTKTVFVPSRFKSKFRFKRPRICNKVTQLSAKIPYPLPNMLDTPVTQVTLADNSTFTIRHEPAHQVKEHVHATLPKLEVNRKVICNGATKQHSQEIIRMRYMDPFENTIQRLAAKFQCSPLYVSSIAPMSKRMSWLTANQIPLSQLNQESERKYALLMAKHRPKKSESLKTYENAKKQYYRNSYRDNGDRMDIITSSMTKYN